MHYFGDNENIDFILERLPEQLVEQTGYGSSPNAIISSSPEFTTNGMLPKCWRRDRGVIKLFKGGTDGASNTGFEPYSEFYAYQIAEKLGIRAIKYNLTKWKGKLCSTCELFTSKDISYVPIGRIVHSGGMGAVRALYDSLGEEYTQSLNDMILLDAIIFNVDRHYGNFGFLVDSHTNKIVAPTPLFDHGNSLFNYAGAERNNLRKLLDFHFKAHSRYNLPVKRRKLIERIIQDRVKNILGE